MAKLVESIGRWGINNHMTEWIIGGMFVVGISFIIWDCVTTLKADKGYRRG